MYLCLHYGLPEAAAYWRSVVDINEWQQHRVVGRLLEAIQHHCGEAHRRIWVRVQGEYGHTRESPAQAVVRDLLGERAIPTITNPVGIGERATGSCRRGRSG